MHKNCSTPEVFSGNLKTNKGHSLICSYPPSRRLPQLNEQMKSCKPSFSFKPIVLMHQCQLRS